MNNTKALEAVATLYHAWLTGLILAVITRKGQDAAEEYVFRLFRRQHLAMFLPGLKKLGLEGEPAAVAAAKYHYLGHLSALQIGMQFKEEISELVQVQGGRSEDFAELFQILAGAQGDEVITGDDQGGIRIVQRGWRLMRQIPGPHECVFDCWNGLWEGLLAAHHPHLKWVVRQRLDQGAECFEWLITSPE